MADVGAGEVAFTLDGHPVTARRGEVIISAAERAGTYIPRFCYHPRMKPVGMCRMCLVEVSGPRGATLQPACFVTVAEGMEVVSTSDKVKKAQDGVLEFLLVNHPLDCPVCDKGGECPLQDQTLAYGPGESRFVEEKRHWAKPIPISDLILLDRERCIQCARCTRFAEEVAGEAQIDLVGRGDRVEVAIFPGKPFTSYFSGNTVQICPVGALTATPYRFTARPWDLDQVESTCTACAFGCRIAVQSSGNRLTRLLGLDADPVNQTWLCDKGRFVFEAVNGDEMATTVELPDAVAHPAVDVVPATAAQIGPLPVVRGQFMGEVVESREVKGGRVTEPMVRKDGGLVSASWAEALAAAAAGLDRARQTAGPGGVALIGGARSTNEGAYAWTRLAKAVIGTDSVDAQLGDGLPAELVLSLPRATIDETCGARVVVLLCGDVREELPVLFLRLRGSVLAGRISLVELSPVETALSKYAAVSLRVRPGESPAVADALTGGEEPAVPSHPEGPSIDMSEVARARDLLVPQPGDGELPDAGTAGADVVVVLGRQSLAEHEGVVADAALRLARALPAARFLTALRRGNVMGALDMGMAPGLLPGRVTLDAGREWFTEGWGSAPEGRGLDATGALRALADRTGEVRALVLLGAEPIGDHPDGHLARQALEAADFVVAVTGHRSAALAHADVVLPVAVEHERPGTTSNLEGRVSRLGQKLVPPGLAWPDWAIATELAAELGGDLGFTGHDEVWREIERLAPCFAGMTQAVLDDPGAQDGLVAPLSPGAIQPGAVLPVDPMATPGVASTEQQGAPPWVGLVEPPADLRSIAALPAPHQQAVAGGPRPEPGAGLAAAARTFEAPHVGPADSYSLRLVAPRTLYDLGAAVRCSPSMVPLVDEAVVRANPYDLDRIGAESGDLVTVRSSRGSLTLVCTADEKVARGVVSIAFNLLSAPADGPDADGVAALIDAAAAVTDVLLESVR